MFHLADLRHLCDKTHLFRSEHIKYMHRHQRMLRRGISLAGVLVLSFSLTSAVHAAESANRPASVRILYFERLVLLDEPTDDSARRSAAAAALPTPASLRFDAFGRRFDLQLEANTRLDLTRSSIRSDAIPPQALRGSIAGVSGSWVRLTRLSSGLHGMLWDGEELYVIAPASNVRNDVTSPIDLGDAETVIFSLSNTVTDFGTGFCAASRPEDTAGESGLDAYRALLGELSASRRMVIQAAGASLRLGVSAIADAGFSQLYSSPEEAEEEILVRLNNVDGIFSSQLGVELDVPTVTAYSANPGQLSSTTDARQLLTSLSQLRITTPSLRSQGLTHLFTGRNLDGNTVGIAYTGEVCHAQYSASLTEARRVDRVWTQSLIAAHEIGHNFGAPHDGEDACADTAQNFLMAPQLNGSSDFSACSLQLMQATMQEASCLTAIAVADVAVPATFATQRAMLSLPFDWSIPVSNIGTGAAEDVVAIISIPAPAVLEQASVPDGSCTIAGEAVTCELGQLADATTRTIVLTLRGDVQGSVDADVTVSAVVDRDFTNNNGSARVTFEPAVDLGIALQGSDSADAGRNTTVRFTASNFAATDSPDFSVDITLSSGLAAGTASLEGAVCTLQAGSVRCEGASLTAGATANGSFTLVDAPSGQHSYELMIGGAYPDPVNTNNSVGGQLSVAALASTGSNGGGGSCGLLLPLLLTGLGTARRRLRAGRRARA